MTSPVEATADSSPKLYTIGTVSKLTGVGTITLRAWERRYELIEPVRKESGHRLYTREHIDHINRITALTARGMRISQIRPDMLKSDLTQLPGAEKNTIWARYIDSMIAAIVSFDEHRLEEIYNEALSLYPIDVLTGNLLKPILVELGSRWALSKGSISEEHFFAFYLRNKLGSRFHHRSQQNTGPRLLLAGLPDEYHEIALLLFGLAAHAEGFRLLLLGASMPLEELAEVAKKSNCNAIVLSGAIEPTQKTLGKNLPDLVQQSSVPVFIGGQSSVLACDAINNSGAEALGVEIEHGLKRLKELVY